MSDGFVFGDDDLDDNAPPSTGSGEYTPAPKGTYRVMIVGTDRKPNKSNTGEIATFKIQILCDAKGDETFGGKTFTDFVNFKHSSETAQRIGQERIAAYRAATGFAPPKRPRTSAEMHDIPFFADLIVEDNNGKKFNRLVKIHLDGQAPTAPAPAPQKQAFAGSPSSKPWSPPANAGGAPWKR